MPVRALLVVLIVLNAGVALWWLARPAAPVMPPAPAASAAGVATLQLVASAADATAAPSPAPASAAAPPVAAVAAAQAGDHPVAAGPVATDAVATAAPVRCLSLGPYASRALAEAAQAAGRAQLQQVHLRERAADDASSYRVVLPTVGDREAAQALLKRIAAAGIGDYYLMSQGEDNTIALGQYRNREGAERRQSALVEAGFPAQLVASGGGAAGWWLDVRTSADAQALQRTLAAPRQRSLDCGGLR